MKKLFFIPVVLFVLLGLFLSASNSAPQNPGVTLHFKDKAGNGIYSQVYGCFGPYNFSSSSGSANLGNVVPGTYGTCASGSGYLGTDSYTVSGVLPYHLTLTMHESEAACAICNED